MEEELAKVNGFERQLVSRLPEPYLVLDPDSFTILHANQAYLTMVGRVLADIVGKTVAHAFPNTDEDASNRLFASLEKCRLGSTDRLEALRYPVSQEPGAEEYIERYWDVWNFPVLDDDGKTRLLLNSPREVTERVLSRRMGDQQERFNKIVGRLGHIGGWSLDIDSQKILLSCQAQLIHGLAASELHFEDALLLYVASDRPKVRRLFSQLFQGGGSFDQQLQIVRPSGEIRWVRLAAELVRSGDQISAQGAIQDVTTHIEREAAHELTTQRFHELLDAMPMMVWTASPRGRIDFCNAHFAEFTGVPSDRLAEGDWHETIAHEDRSSTSLAWRQAVARQVPFEQTVRLIDVRTSQPRWHVVRATPNFDDAGQLVSWYGTAADVDEVIRLEHESTRLADQLRSTFDSITDAFMVVDREWKFVFLTDRAVSLLKRPRSELIGRSLWEEFSPTLGTIVEKEYRRAMTESVTVQFETYYPPLETWFSATAYPSVEGLAVYFKDITLEKRQQQQIEESEERLRAIANASVDAIYDLNIQTGELWWSEGIISAFGYSADDLVRTSDWETRIHPADRDEVGRRYANAQADGASILQLEYRFLSQAGDYRAVVDQCRFFYRDGDAYRVIGGIRDVSNLKKAEAGLRQQAELINKAQDAVIVRDLQHHILLWNPSAERIYGWKATEVLGKRLPDLGINDPVQFERAHAQLIAQKSWHGELKQMARDGKLLTIEARWSLIEGQDDVPDRILAINTDQTEQKRLEENLHQSRKLEALGQLTGGVAHDFNNLLMIIAGNAELLEDELGDDPNLLQTTQMITRAATQGAELTSRLLAFGRQQTLEPVEVDAADLLASAEPVWRRTLPDHITLEIASHGQVHARADHSQLELALLNLVLNARDALKRGGTLQVAVRERDIFAPEAESLEVQEGKYAEFSVGDNGVGIPPENLDKLFDPFFSTKPIGRGTGLGLSMVYGFARQSGGAVTVHSIRDIGTTINLLLPAADTPTPRQSEDRRTSSNLSGLRILAVDDNEALLESQLRLLASLGLRSTGAANADIALKILERDAAEFDLLLSDVVMPGSMSGVGLANVVVKRWPNIGIVLVSGNVEHGGESEDVSDHIFLQKPFRRARLSDALSRAITSIPGRQ